MTIAPCSLERLIRTGQDAHHTCVMTTLNGGDAPMLDRAIATQHAKLALAETARTQAPRNLRRTLRFLKERCLRLLRTLSEFVSAGGSLS
jgi:hypothetical protein